MSTRCQVEIYTGYYDEKHNYVMSKTPDFRMYHHEDGEPAYMVCKIHRFMVGASEFIKNRLRQPWWDPLRVGNVMVLLSVEDYFLPMLPFSTDRPDRRDYVRPDNEFGMPYRNGNGMPDFQAGVNLHGDIEYLYRVYLGQRFGEYELKAFRPHYRAKGPPNRFTEIVDIPAMPKPKKRVTPEPVET